MADEADSAPELYGDERDEREQTAIGERYRKIFRHSNDAILVVDLDSESFVDVNPAACELLGYSRPELLGMNPESIHPDDIDRVREEFIGRVLDEGSGFTDDMQCLTKDGETIPTEISAAALHPDGDEPARMVAMLRDVSDRVEHRRELEEKVERLDRFARIVSHDLRTPLSLIRGRAELAAQTGDDEYLDAIEDAVDRMDGMLSELLQLTRTGTVVEATAAVELDAVARTAWGDLGTEDATLTVGSSLTVEADRERLRQLFENLFRNAIDHGGPSVAVRVGAIGTGGDGLLRRGRRPRYSGRRARGRLRVGGDDDGGGHGVRPCDRQGDRRRPRLGRQRLRVRRGRYPVRGDRPVTVRGFCRSRRADHPR